MRRRELITLLGGAALSWPFVARAQQPAMPTVGFLGPATAAGFASYIEGFRRGLGASGFVEGRSVAVEYRWADNQLDRLSALAAELVERRVAVIATGSATAAALAAKAATSTIPIVFAVGADPVKFGLVASMNRPGGNVTGVSFLANTLVAKQLQLLQGLSPTSGVIGVLVNPGNPNAASDSAMAQAAAASLRLKIHVVHTVAERDLDAAFDDFRLAPATAVLLASVSDVLHPGGCFAGSATFLLHASPRSSMLMARPSRQGALRPVRQQCLPRREPVCRSGKRTGRWNPDRPETDENTAELFAPSHSLALVEAHRPREKCRARRCLPEGPWHTGLAERFGVNPSTVHRIGRPLTAQASPWRSG
jgi:ABC-type uncharacterized transport system substrate-binding protein